MHKVNDKQREHTEAALCVREIFIFLMCAILYAVNTYVCIYACVCYDRTIHISVLCSICAHRLKIVMQLAVDIKNLEFRSFIYAYRIYWYTYEFI